MLVATIILIGLAYLLLTGKWTCGMLPAILVGVVCAIVIISGFLTSND